jgi:serine/threonine-protein kinase RsbW
MFPLKPELSISIPSRTELLKMLVELTRHIATLSQFSTSEAQKIALAVDEAITNVIKHSYRYEMGGDIKVDFFCQAKGIKIKISFAGIPPDVQGDGVDLNRMIKAKKKGGLGVELMKRIMDSVEYRTLGNINICEMIKWKTQES